MSQVPDKDGSKETSTDDDMVSEKTYVNQVISIRDDKTKNLRRSTSRIVPPGSYRVPKKTPQETKMQKDTGTQTEPSILSTHQEFDISIPQDSHNNKEDASQKNPNATTELPTPRTSNLLSSFATLNFFNDDLKAKGDKETFTNDPDTYTTSQEVTQGTVRLDASKIFDNSASLTKLPSSYKPSTIVTLELEESKTIVAKEETRLSDSYTVKEPGERVLSSKLQRMYGINLNNDNASPGNHSQVPTVTKFEERQNDVGKTPRVDTSFRSLVSALSIFLALSLVVVFVGTKSLDNKEPAQKIVYKGEVALIGREKPAAITEAPILKATPYKTYLVPIPPPSKPPPLTTLLPVLTTSEKASITIPPPTFQSPVATFNATSTSLNTTTSTVSETTQQTIPNATSSLNVSITTQPTVAPTTLLLKPVVLITTTVVPKTPPDDKGTSLAETKVPTPVVTTLFSTSSKPTTVPKIFPTTLPPIITTLLPPNKTTTPPVPVTTTTKPTTTAKVTFPSLPTTIKPITTLPPTTTLQPTTVDQWVSDNYWNDTNIETDFSPLVKRSVPVCTTPACKSTGSRMLSLLDYSVDPCENFYDFACGGGKPEIPDGDTWRRILEQLYFIDSTSPVFLQKYRLFYDSCVVHEYEFNYNNRIATVLQLVKEVGDIVFDKTQAANVDLTQLFAKLILRQSLRIIDVDIDTDPQSTKFLIKINIPKKLSVLKETGPWSSLTDDQQRCLTEQKMDLHAPNVDLNKIHSSYLECQKNQGIYLNSIETVVRALGFLTGDEFTQTQQIQDLRTTIEWGILDHLNELPSPNEQRKILLYKKYEVQKLSVLQTNYPFLQWKPLLEALTGHKLDDTTPVQVYFPEYFKKLSEELQKLPAWKVKNALIAMYAQDLYENLVVPQAKHGREFYCVQVGAKVFPDVSAHLYMKTWPMDEVGEAQQFLTKIFNQLKAKLMQGIEKADWVDQGSKIPMISKLKNKLSLVFNKKDDVYNDVAGLNEKYGSLMLNESNFMENAIILLHSSKKNLFDLQGKLYNVKYLWGNFVNPWDRDPKSFYAKGLIVLPMGVIRIPVQEEFPGYLMMSQLGLVVARELARHFDLVGIQRGITLSPSFKRSFKSFRKIMEDKTVLTGTRIHQKRKIIFQGDPQLSANERIVDNTAIRLITDSFHSLGEATALPWVSTSFSREKIFFITIAQEYCKSIDMSQYMEDVFENEVLPPSLRVENIVSNSEAFQKTFECPDGSAMNNNPNFKLQFPYLYKPEESEDDEDEDDSDDYLSNNQL